MNMTVVTMFEAMNESVGQGCIIPKMFPPQVSIHQWPEAEVHYISLCYILSLRHPCCEDHVLLQVRSEHCVLSGMVTLRFNSEQHR